MNTLSSVEFLRPVWVSWKVLGLLRADCIPPSLFPLYRCSVLLLFPVMFHLHFVIGLFFAETTSDAIECMATSVLTLACIAKFVWFGYNFDKFRQIETLLRHLDGRIRNAEHGAIFAKARAHMVLLGRSMAAVLVACVVASQLQGIIRGKLLFPGFIPFDWQRSDVAFAAADLYQLMGLSMTLTQTFPNDFLPPVLLCILSLHVRLLRIRVAAIGQTTQRLHNNQTRNEATEHENERELNRCIIDHANLYRLYNIVVELISAPMFVQFCIGGFNFCVTVAVLVFTESFVQRLYYLAHLMCMVFQTLPACYYGTSMEDEFEWLHFSAFSCEWVQQGHRFKRKLLVFIERSLRRTTGHAIFIPIHLTTFLATLKAAYSLFALIMQYK